jgi:hypothetical protein
MLFPALFKELEAARWSLADDVPWDRFDGARLSDEQARSVRSNAITEWSALPATEMFLRDNRHDSDFSAFMSIWFYEEQKHALALMEYLRRFRPDLLPSEAELHAVRFEFDPAPPLETLMLHFCGEVRLTQWYRRAAEWHEEPVLRHLYELIARDEARHGGAYLRYMQRALERTPAQARAAFARIGFLMASSGRAGKALHPTNLHVARALFPGDTVQSRLPDPGWLTVWLDEQIHFDEACEERVVGGILRNLSVLLGQRFESVRDLNRYRKSLPDPASRAGHPAAPVGDPTSPASQAR